MEKRLPNLQRDGKEKGDIMYGIPIRTIVLGVVVLVILAFGARVGCRLNKLVKIEAAYDKQVAETKACNDSVEDLTYAVQEQTRMADDLRIAGETANEMYYEIANRPPTIKVVPRDRIVEVIRPGNCDRAALDAYDLLHRERTSWKKERTVEEWATYYSQPYSAWAPAAALPPAVLPNSHAVSEFRLYVKGSQFQNHSLPWSGQETWISGQIVLPANR